MAANAAVMPSLVVSEWPAIRNEIAARIAPTVDFPDLLLTPGVGARTVRSLAMVAEIVHGAPYRFRDPARFSLAHGGKDRLPTRSPSRSTTRPSAS
jgi:hypothetical protein